MAENRQEERGRNDVPVNTRAEHETSQSAPARRRDVGTDPFALMNTFRREMDHLFDDFGLIGTGWSPQIEVCERDGKLHVCADLPGLDKDDVRVEFMENNLTIEGERRSEERDERNGWSERSYGRFFRSIPLPDGVNADTAKASFENGVLDITFDAPKP